MFADNCQEARQKPSGLFRKKMTLKGKEEEKYTERDYRGQSKREVSKGKWVEDRERIDEEDRET